MFNNLNEDEQRQAFNHNCLKAIRDMVMPIDEDMKFFKSEIEQSQMQTEMDYQRLSDTITAQNNTITA